MALNGDAHLLDGDRRDWFDRARPAPSRRPVRLDWFESIEPPDDEWLVHAILPRRGLAAIYGGVAAGKSFLALDWAQRIAVGLRVMDAETERVGVVYVGGEGHGGLRKRIAAWRRFHADAIEGDVPFALVASTLDLRTAASGDVNDLIEELNEARFDFDARDVTLGVIFIDTLASVTAGMAESSSEGMTSAIAALQRIAEETGALVVLIHHCGKDEERGMRGHSSLLAAVDTTIEIVKEKATGIHMVTLRKQKDGDDERVLGAFTRRSIEVGRGRKGLPIVSAVIEYGEAVPKRSKAERANGNERLLLKAIRKAVATHGSACPEHLLDRVPASAIVVSQDAVRKEVHSMGLSHFTVTDEATATENNRARQRLSRTLENLAAQGVLGRHKVHNGEIYLWIAGEV